MICYIREKILCLVAIEYKLYRLIFIFGYIRNIDFFYVNINSSFFFLYNNGLGRVIKRWRNVTSHFEYVLVYNFHIISDALETFSIVFRIYV